MRAHELSYTAKPSSVNFSGGEKLRARVCNNGRFVWLSLGTLGEPVYKDAICIFFDSPGAEEKVERLAAAINEIMSEPESEPARNNHVQQAFSELKAAQ